MFCEIVLVCLQTLLLNCTSVFLHLLSISMSQPFQQYGWIWNRLLESASRLCWSQIKRNSGFFLISVIFKCFVDIFAHHMNNGFHIKGDIYWNLALITLTLSPLNMLFGIMSSNAYELKPEDLASILASVYYHGYLSKIASYLDDCVQASDFGNLLKYPPMYHILIPSNGIVHDVISDAEKRIQFYRNSASILIDNAGVCDRPYLHSLYKVRVANEEIFCLLEYASVLRHVNDMEKCITMETNSAKNCCRKFHEILAEKMRRHPKIGRKVKLILFSGKISDIADAVIKAE